MRGGRLVEAECYALLPGSKGDEQQVRIRWVWLDETADETSHPVAPSSALAELRSGQLTSVRVREIDGAGLYCTYFPVELIGDNRRGALEMTESLARRDQYTRSTVQRTILLMGAMIVAAMLLVGVAGLRLIGRPLQALMLKTQQIAAGDLRSPVLVSGSDELATLATALNTMSAKLDESQQAVQRESTQRLEAIEQLRHGDRLKTVGRLASGVAHELGTPLNVVSGRAGLIASGKLSDDDVVQSAKDDSVRSDAHDRNCAAIAELCQTFVAESHALQSEFRDRSNGMVDGLHDQEQERSS